MGPTEGLFAPAESNRDQIRPLMPRLVPPRGHRPVPDPLLRRRRSALRRTFDRSLRFKDWQNPNCEMGDRIGLGETRKVVLVQLRSEAMASYSIAQEGRLFYFGFSVFCFIYLWEFYLIYACSCGEFFLIG